MSERAPRKPIDPGNQVLYSIDTATAKSKLIDVTELIKSSDHLDIDKAGRLLKAKARLVQFIDQKYGELEALTNPNAQVEAPVAQPEIVTAPPQSSTVDETPARPLETPAWKPHEDDFAWGHAFVLTGKQSRSVIAKLRLFPEEVKSEDEAIELVFREGLEKGEEWFGALRTYVPKAAGSGLNKIRAALEEVSQLRKEDVLFPLTEEELKELQITPDTPNSLMFYQRLNDRFANQGFTSVYEAVTGKKYEASQPQEVAVPTSEAAILVRTEPAFQEFTPQQLILKGELGRAFTSIVTFMPDEVLNDITGLLSGDIQITRGELVDMAQTVLDFQNGKIAVPSIEDFLYALTDGGKIEIAKRALQGFIASSIAESLEKVGQMGMAMKLAQHVNRLSLFLGQQEGKKHIAQALAELPTAQRTLLYKTMSTNLKVELDYPDLYECDEYQMARYLKQVTHRKPITEPQTKYDRDEMMIRYPVNSDQMERLGTLLNAIVDRAGQRFIPARVIDYLCEEADPKLFRRLIDIATLGEDLDNLYILFQENTATEVFARRVQRILDGEEEDQFKPDYTG